MGRPLERVEIYFKFNRILLSLIGQWPYQMPRESRLAMGIILLFTVSIFIPMIAGLFKVRHDLDSVIECLSPFGMSGLTFVKLFNLMMNKNKMKHLLMEIQKDFDNAISGPETVIFERYRERSIKSSKIQAIVMYSIGAMFILPLIRHTSSPIMNTEMNETVSSRRFPFIVDYFVDTDEYYYLIILHSSIAMFAFGAIMVAAESLFMVYLHHGCARFVVLKYRISQITEPGKFDADMNRSEIDNLVYQKVKICIRLHQEAIGFADEIESAYTIFQLVQVCLCCLLISITGLHASTKLDMPSELLRYFGIMFAMMIQLLLYSLPSQELMDLSVSVSDAIYNTEWYRLSPRTRKLLFQMMMRSLEASKITAGKLYVMSMENYSGILQTSISYFTVFSSIHKQAGLTE